MTVPVPGSVGRRPALRLGLPESPSPVARFREDVTVTAPFVMREDVMSGWSQVVPEENWSGKFYKDTRNKWTMGVGILMEEGPEEEDIPQHARIMGVTEEEARRMTPMQYKAYYDANPMEQTEQEILSKRAWQRNWKRGRDWLLKNKDFDINDIEALPTEVANVVARVLYQMGEGFFDKFPMATQAMLEGDYNRMAAEFRKSDWWRVQTRDRAEREARNLENYAASVSRRKEDRWLLGLDDEKPGSLVVGPPKPAALQSSTSFNYDEWMSQGPKKKTYVDWLKEPAPEARADRMPVTPDDAPTLGPGEYGPVTPGYKGWYPKMTAGEVFTAPFHAQPAEPVEPARYAGKDDDWGGAPTKDWHPAELRDWIQRAKTTDQKIARRLRVSELGHALTAWSGLSLAEARNEALPITGDPKRDKELRAELGRRTHSFAAGATSISGYMGSALAQLFRDEEGDRAASRAEAVLSALATAQMDREGITTQIADIEGVGDFMSWLAYAAGHSLPTLGLSFATAPVGGAIGGAVAGLIKAGPTMARMLTAGGHLVGGGISHAPLSIHEARLGTTAQRGYFPTDMKWHDLLAGGVAPVEGALPTMGAVLFSAAPRKVRLFGSIALDAFGEGTGEYARQAISTHYADRPLSGHHLHEALEEAAMSLVLGGPSAVVADRQEQRRLGATRVLPPTAPEPAPAEAAAPAETVEPTPQPAPEQPAPEQPAAAPEPAGPETLEAAAKRLAAGLDQAVANVIHARIAPELAEPAAFPHHREHVLEAEKVNIALAKAGKELLLNPGQYEMRGFEVRPDGSLGGALKDPADFDLDTTMTMLMLEHERQAGIRAERAEQAKREQDVGLNPKEMDALRVSLSLMTPQWGVATGERDLAEMQRLVDATIRARKLNAVEERHGRPPLFDLAALPPDMPNTRDGASTMHAALTRHDREGQPTTQATDPVPSDEAQLGAWVRRNEKTAPEGTGASTMLEHEGWVAYFRRGRLHRADGPALFQRGKEAEGEYWHEGYPIEGETAEERALAWNQQQHAIKRGAEKFLKQIRGIGPKRFDALIERFGSAEAVEDASEVDIAKVVGFRQGKKVREAFDALDRDLPSSNMTEFLERALRVGPADGAQSVVENVEMGPDSLFDALESRADDEYHVGRYQMIHVSKPRPTGDGSQEMEVRVGKYDSWPYFGELNKFKFVGVLRRGAKGPWRPADVGYADTFFEDFGLPSNYQLPRRTEDVLDVLAAQEDVAVGILYQDEKIPPTNLPYRYKEERIGPDTSLPEIDALIQPHDSHNKSPLLVGEEVRGPPSNPDDPDSYPTWRANPVYYYGQYQGKIYLDSQAKKPLKGWRGSSWLKGKVHPTTDKGALLNELHAYYGTTKQSDDIIPENRAGTQNIDLHSESTRTPPELKSWGLLTDRRLKAMLEMPKQSEKSHAGTMTRPDGSKGTWKIGHPRIKSTAIPPVYRAPLFVDAKLYGWFERSTGSGHLVNTADPPTVPVPKSKKAPEGSTSLQVRAFDQWIWAATREPVGVDLSGAAAFVRGMERNGEFRRSYDHFRPNVYKEILGDDKFNQAKKIKFLPGAEPRQVEADLIIQRAPGLAYHSIDPAPEGSRHKLVLHVGTQGKQPRAALEEAIMELEQELKAMPGEIRSVLIPDMGMAVQDYIGLVHYLATAAPPGDPSELREIIVLAEEPELTVDIQRENTWRNLQAQSGDVMTMLMEAQEDKVAKKEIPSPALAYIEGIAGKQKIKLAFELVGIAKQTFMGLTDMERGRLWDWLAAGGWDLDKPIDAFARPFPAAFERLESEAPSQWYEVGRRTIDAMLAERPGVAIAGTRDSTPDELDYAMGMAAAAARSGRTVISGAAGGADMAAMRAALEAGGTAIGIVSDDLVGRILKRPLKDAMSLASYVKAGRLIFATQSKPGAHWSIEALMERNKYIYVLSQRAIVVSSHMWEGGSWNGAITNLVSKWGVPLSVRETKNINSGNRLLPSFGARVIPATRAKEYMDRRLVIPQPSERWEWVSFSSLKDALSPFLTMKGGYPLFVNGVAVPNADTLYRMLLHSNNPALQAKILETNRTDGPVAAKEVSEAHADEIPFNDDAKFKILSWVTELKVFQNYEYLVPLLEATGDRPIYFYTSQDADLGAHRVRDEATKEYSWEGGNWLGKAVRHIRTKVYHGRAPFKWVDRSMGTRNFGVKPEFWTKRHEDDVTEATTPQRMWKLNLSFLGRPLEFPLGGLGWTAAHVARHEVVQGTALAREAAIDKDEKSRQWRALARRSEWEQTLREAEREREVVEGRSQAAKTDYWEEQRQIRDAGRPEFFKEYLRRIVPIEEVRDDEGEIAKGEDGKPILRFRKIKKPPEGAVPRSRDLQVGALLASPKKPGEPDPLSPEQWRWIARRMMRKPYSTAPFTWRSPGSLLALEATTIKHEIMRMGAHREFAERVALLMSGERRLRLLTTAERDQIAAERLPPEPEDDAAVIRHLTAGDPSVKGHIAENVEMMGDFPLRKVTPDMMKDLPEDLQRRMEKARDDETRFKIISEASRRLTGIAVEAPDPGTPGKTLDATTDLHGREWLGEADPNMARFLTHGLTNEEMAMIREALDDAGKRPGDLLRISPAERDELFIKLPAKTINRINRLLSEEAIGELLHPTAHLAEYDVRQTKAIYDYESQLIEEQFEKPGELTAHLYPTELLESRGDAPAEAPHPRLDAREVAQRIAALDPAEGRGVFDVRVGAGDAARLDTEEFREAWRDIVRTGAKIAAWVDVSRMPGTRSEVVVIDNRLSASLQTQQPIAGAMLEADSQAAYERVLKRVDDRIQDALAPDQRGQALRRLLRRDPLQPRTRRAKRLLKRNPGRSRVDNIEMPFDAVMNALTPKDRTAVIKDFRRLMTVVLGEEAAAEIDVYVGADRIRKSEGASKRWRGVYYPALKQIAILENASFRGMLGTFAHELLHAVRTQVPEQTWKEALASVSKHDLAWAKRFYPEANDQRQREEALAEQVKRWAVNPEYRLLQEAPPIARQMFGGAFAPDQSAIARIMRALRRMLRRFRVAVARLSEATQQTIARLGDLLFAHEEAAAEEARAEPRTTYEPKAKGPKDAAGEDDIVISTPLKAAQEAALTNLEKAVGQPVAQYVGAQLGLSPGKLAEYYTPTQVDALALAMRGHEEGHGFLLGDQTGTGKGRVLAGMAEYARRKGLPVIYMTERDGLYRDFTRDLLDTGFFERFRAEHGRAPRILISDAGKGKMKLGVDPLTGETILPKSLDRAKQDVLMRSARLRARPPSAAGQSVMSVLRGVVDRPMSRRSFLSKTSKATVGAAISPAQLAKMGAGVRLFARVKNWGNEINPSSPEEMFDEPVEEEIDLALAEAKYLVEKFGLEVKEEQGGFLVHGPGTKEATDSIFDGDNYIENHIRHLARLGIDTAMREKSHSLEMQAQKVRKAMSKEKSQLFSVFKAINALGELTEKNVARHAPTLKPLFARARALASKHAASALLENDLTRKINEAWDGRLHEWGVDTSIVKELVERIQHAREVFFQLRIAALRAKPGAKASEISAAEDDLAEARREHDANISAFSEGAGSAQAVAAEEGEEYDILFSTYAQVRPRGEGATLTQQVVKNLSDGAFLLLDEAHSAASNSAQGEFVRGMTGNAAGVTFSSATAIDRLANWEFFGPELGIFRKNRRSFRALVNRLSGDPEREEAAMEALAYHATAQGAMRRVELDLEKIGGIETATVPMRAGLDWDGAFRGLMHQTAELATMVRDAEAARPVAERVGTRSAQTALHHLVKMFAFMSKAPAIPDMVRKSMEAGEAPVVAFDENMDAPVARSRTAAFHRDPKRGQGARLLFFEPPPAPMLEGLPEDHKDAVLRRARRQALLRALTEHETAARSALRGEAADFAATAKAVAGAADAYIASADLRASPALKRFRDDLTLGALESVDDRRRARSVIAAIPGLRDTFPVMAKDVFLTQVEDMFIGNDGQQHAWTPELAKAYARLVDEVQADAALDDVPASPVSYLHHQLQAMGYSTAEISGRRHDMSYAGRSPRATDMAVTTGDEKNAIIADFNAGKTDVLLLNRAGSTGISLHASTQFKNQKRRHMFVAQPPESIRQFIQVVGRIHRRGNVPGREPRYTLVTGDAPFEQRTLHDLWRKASAMAAGISGTRAGGIKIAAPEGVEDLGTLSGEWAATRFLWDNPMEASLLGMEEGAPPLADLYNLRTLTRRMAVLPWARQQEIIEWLSEQVRSDRAYNEARGWDFESPDTAARLTIKPSKPREKDLARGFWLVAAQVTAAEQPHTLDTLEARLRQLAPAETVGAGMSQPERLVALSEELGDRFRADTWATLQAYRAWRGRAPLAGRASDHEAVRRENMQEARRLYAPGNIGYFELTPQMGKDLALVLKFERSARHRPGVDNPLRPDLWEVTFALSRSGREVTRTLDQLPLLSQEESKPTQAMFAEFQYRAELHRARDDTRPAVALIGDKLAEAMWWLSTDSDYQIMPYEAEDGGTRYALVLGEDLGVDVLDHGIPLRPSAPPDATPESVASELATADLGLNPDLAANQERFDDALGNVSLTVTESAEGQRDVEITLNGTKAKHEKAGVVKDGNVEFARTEVPGEFTAVIKDFKNPEVREKVLQPLLKKIMTLYGEIATPSGSKIGAEARALLTEVVGRHQITEDPFNEDHAQGRGMSRPTNEIRGKLVPDRELVWLTVFERGWMGIDNDETVRANVRAVNDAKRIGIPSSPVSDKGASYLNDLLGSGGFGIRLTRGLPQVEKSQKHHGVEIAGVAEHALPTIQRYRIAVGFTGKKRRVRGKPMPENVESLSKPAQYRAFEESKTRQLQRTVWYRPDKLAYADRADAFEASMEGRPLPQTVMEAIKAANAEVPSRGHGAPTHLRMDPGGKMWAFHDLRDMEGIMGYLEHHHEEVTADQIVQDPTYHRTLLQMANQAVERTAAWAASKPQEAPPKDRPAAYEPTRAAPPGGDDDAKQSPPPQPPIEEEERPVTLEKDIAEFEANHPDARHLSGLLRWVLPARQMFGKSQEKLWILEMLEKVINRAGGDMEKVTRWHRDLVVSRWESLGEADQTRATELIVESYDGKGWPTSEKALTDAKEKGADSALDVANFIEGVVEYLDNVSDVFERNSEQFRGLALREEKKIIEDVAKGDETKEIALTGYSALIRRQMKVAQDSLDAQWRRYNNRFNPDPRAEKQFNRPRSPMWHWSPEDIAIKDEAEAYIDQSVKAGQEAERIRLQERFVFVAKAATFVKTKDRIAGYYPHRFYGKYMVMRITTFPNRSLVEYVDPELGTKGFETLDDAMEAASRDQKQKKFAGPGNREWRIINRQRMAPEMSAKGPRDEHPVTASWMRSMILEIAKESSREAVEAVVNKHNEQLKDARMPLISPSISEEALEQFATTAAGREQLWRKIRPEAERSLLGAARRRTGKRGFSTDVVPTLLDFGTSVASNAIRDVGALLGLGELHRMGGGLDEKTRTSSDPYTNAWRSLVRSVMGLPGWGEERLQRFANWQIPDVLNKRIKKNSFMDVWIKGTLMTMAGMLPMVMSAGTTQRITFGLWLLIAAPVMAVVQSAIAASMTIRYRRGGGTDDSVLMDYARMERTLMSMAKLFPHMLHLGYAVQNLLQYFMMMPSELGFSNAVAGLSYYLAYKRGFGEFKDAELSEAVRKGIEEAGIAYQSSLFTDVADDPLSASRTWSGRFIRTWTYMGVASERWGREAAYVAAYMAGRNSKKLRSQAEVEQEIKKLVGTGLQADRLKADELRAITLNDWTKTLEAFASTTEKRAMFDYSTLNRPDALRIRVPGFGGIFQFKNFLVQFLGRLWEYNFSDTPTPGRMLRMLQTGETSRGLSDRFLAVSNLMVWSSVFPGAMTGLLGIPSILGWTLEWLFRQLNGEDDEDEPDPIGLKMRGDHASMMKSQSALKRLVGGGLPGMTRLLDVQGSTSIVQGLPVPVGRRLVDYQLHQMFGPMVTTQLKMLETLDRHRAPARPSLFENPEAALSHMKDVSRELLADVAPQWGNVLSAIHWMRTPKERDYFFDSKGRPMRRASHKPGDLAPDFLPDAAKRWHTPVMQAFGLTSHELAVARLYQTFKIREEAEKDKKVDDFRRNLRNIFKRAPSTATSVLDIRGELRRELEAVVREVEMYGKTRLGRPNPDSYKAPILGGDITGPFNAEARAAGLEAGGTDTPWQAFTSQRQLLNPNLHVNDPRSRR